MSSLFKLTGNVRVIKLIATEITRPRAFPATVQRFYSSENPKPKKQKVSVTFLLTNGEKIVGTGKEGDSILDIVVNNNLGFDGYGACEGTLACSTCHVVVNKEHFDKIENPRTDEEIDMIDLAFGSCDTSRLGCQINLTKALDGMVVQVPAGVNDARNA